MRKFFQHLLDSFQKCDRVLLALCMLTTAFGCVIIASATNHIGFARYILIQLIAASIGIVLFCLISSADLDFVLEHRTLLSIFSVGLILLLIPFGDWRGGNRSWIDFPFLPINVQPAEICKITYILIMASVMVAHQQKLSSFSSILHMAFHLILLVGLNVIISKDAGVSLIFVFIALGMAFAGGVSMFWFLLAGGAITAVFPLLWKFVFDSYQKNRILILFDSSIDPLAINERYHTNQNLLSLTAGGFSGQGLFNGSRTTVGALTAQHTDYIFSAIGEELGFVGCLAIIALEIAIIGRCIYIGTQSPDFARRLVCFGAASALIFQVTSNLGMCLGFTPVIGLTLPFVSYGGSSILTCYAMLGLVSGVHARPSPGKQGMYVQPPR